MIEKDDMRLAGQERYLKDKTLFFQKWIPHNEEWEHDHCEFCWEKFSDAADSLQEGYTTEDRYYWICSECFEDFKESFGWKITKAESDT